MLWKVWAWAQEWASGSMPNRPVTKYNIKGKWRMWWLSPPIGRIVTTDGSNLKIIIRRFSQLKWMENSINEIIFLETSSIGVVEKKQHQSNGESYTYPMRGCRTMALGLWMALLKRMTQWRPSLAQTPICCNSSSVKYKFPVSQSTDTSSKKPTPVFIKVWETINKVHVFIDLMAKKLQCAIYLLMNTCFVF